MITLKELQYVSDWAKKIPMPGIEYSTNVMKEIEDCYNLFNKIYKNKEYNFIFSNGEEITFEILSKNLCHMLGIDYSNIKSSYFDKYRKDVLGTTSKDLTSYDLIELLIGNIEKVVEHDNNPHSKAKAINYYKSGVKCAIFKKISDFDKFNFAAINYNSKDGKRESDFEKLLFISSNESVCPYFMMGITKNNDSENKDSVIEKYIVNTLLAPNNPKPYFEEQEVIIPTQILISDNDNLTKLNATASEKIQLLTLYKSIINKYNIPNRINIYGDYEVMLNDQDNFTKRIKR